MNELRARLMLDAQQPVKAVQQLKQGLAQAISGMSSHVKNQAAGLTNLQTTLQRFQTSLQNVAAVRNAGQQLARALYEPQKQALAQAQQAFQKYIQHIQSQPAAMKPGIARTQAATQWTKTKKDLWLEFFNKEERALKAGLSEQERGRLAQLRAQKATNKRMQPEDRSEMLNLQYREQFQAPAAQDLQRLALLREGEKSAKEQSTLMERAMRENVAAHQRQAFLEKAQERIVMASQRRPHKMSAMGERQNARGAFGAAFLQQREFGKILNEHVRAKIISPETAKQEYAAFADYVKRLGDAADQTQAKLLKMGQALSGKRDVSVLENNRKRMEQTGMRGLWQRVNARMMGSGSGHMQTLIATMAGGFGFGRFGAMGAAIGGMSKLGGPWGMVIGAAVDMVVKAFTRLFNFIKNGIQELSALSVRIQNIRAQTGIGTKSLTVMARTSEMAGTDLQSASLWISRFQANLSNFQKTPPGVQNALAKLGLNVMQLRNLRPEKQLELVTQRMNQLGNATDRAGVANALFNRLGAEMLRWMRLFPLAIEQMGRLPELMEVWGQKWEYLGHTLTGVRWKMLQLSAGMMTQLTPALEIIARKFNAMDFTNLGEALGKLFKPILGDVAKLVIAVDSLKKMFDGFQKFKADLFDKLIPQNIMTKFGKKLWENLKPDFFDRLFPVGIVPRRIGRLGNFVAELYAAFKDTDKSLSYMERMKAAFKRLVRDPKLDKDDPNNPQPSAAALSSFFAPFGKGPGGQWSNIGFWSTPDVQGGFQTGIKGWQDKVVDYLKEIAVNTRTMRDPRTGQSFKVNSKTMPQHALNPENMQDHLVTKGKITAPIQIAGAKTENIAATGKPGTTYTSDRLPGATSFIVPPGITPGDIGRLTTPAPMAPPDFKGLQPPAEKGNVTVPALPLFMGDPHVRLDGKRVTGGPVSAGGMYLVGEKGPELFRPRLGGSIVPNQGLKQFLPMQPGGSSFARATDLLGKIERKIGDVNVNMNESPGPLTLAY